MIKQSVLSTEIGTIRCLAGNDVTFATVPHLVAKEVVVIVERVDRGGGWRSEDALNA